MRVPVSKDGSAFDPITCQRGDGYWVGPKGAEHKFSRYEDACAALNLMVRQYWRRPNPQGYWGVVVGVGWV